MKRKMKRFFSAISITCVFNINNVRNESSKRAGCEPRARSIQPKFQPVRPGKEDHLKRWTSFFETFPVGPNRSIEFWTEISGNFGWMDRAPSFVGMFGMSWHVTWRSWAFLYWPAVGANTGCLHGWRVTLQGGLTLQERSKDMLSLHVESCSSGYLY